MQALTAPPPQPPPGRLVGPYYRSGQALLSCGVQSSLLTSVEAGAGLRLTHLCADVESFLQRACAQVLAEDVAIGRLLVALRPGADVADTAVSLVVAATACSSPVAAQAVKSLIGHVKRLYA